MVDSGAGMADARVESDEGWYWKAHLRLDLGCENSVDSILIGYPEPVSIYGKEGDGRKRMVL